MAEVVLDGITKVYDNGFEAVSDLSINVSDGEFVVLVGPSGCGKTTALRMVAGLEDITEGDLRIGERVVNDVPPKDRDIAMVFQSYALYPHMSVAQNIGYALRLRKRPKSEIDERVRKAAEMLDLVDYLDRRPKQLSGGQRQRVAMGRAIVRQPQVFLMDEPLSNLDAKLRVQMRAGISSLQHELGVTTIYVTHDQVEAMTMGDRVAVLNKGLLQQIDSPQRLYDHPDNLFVAGFIGSPPMNLAVATLTRQDGGYVAVLGSGARLTVPAEAVEARPSLAGYADRKLALGIRSEDMEDVGFAPPTDAGSKLSASVTLTEALGSEIMVHFGVDAEPVLAGAGPRMMSAEAGEDEIGSIGTEKGKTPFVASFTPRSRVKVGETIDIAVDTARMHYFDLDSGQAIR